MCCEVNNFVTMAKFSLQSGVNIEYKTLWSGDSRVKFEQESQNQDSPLAPFLGLTKV